MKIHLAEKQKEDIVRRVVLGDTLRSIASDYDVLVRHIEHIFDTKATDAEKHAHYIKKHGKPVFGDDKMRK